MSTSIPFADCLKNPSSRHLEGHDQLQVESIAISGGGVQTVRPEVLGCILWPGLTEYPQLFQHVSSQPFITTVKQSYIPSV